MSNIREMIKEAISESEIPIDIILVNPDILKEFYKEDFGPIESTFIGKLLNGISTMPTLIINNIEVKPMEGIETYKLI